METEEPHPVPVELQEFVRLFNQQKFWDSHEALEGPWRLNRSEFYHGLILYASALVHLQRGNSHGVSAQFTKAARALAAYRPSYLGVEVDELLAWAGAMAGPVPRIELRLSKIRGDEPELKPPNETE